MKTSESKVVWLTGASSGIGEAMAIALSSRGYRLILSARNTERLEHVKRYASRQAGDIHVLPLDLTRGEELDKHADEAWRHFGRIDCLVLNAGVAVRDLAINTTESMDRMVMETNYFGPVQLAKRILPRMLNAGNGHIVAVSSLSGKYGVPRLSSYAASKHALHGFFDSLRAEVSRQGIAISVVVPGFIRTPLAEHARDGLGRPYGKAITVNSEGMTAESCAGQIVRAIEQQREEVRIGGIETVSVILHRLFPSLFRRIISNHPMRRIRKWRQLI